MRAVNGIAAKFDDLASKKDLERVERDLHQKLHDKARETGQQIQTNNRIIKEVRQEMADQKGQIERLEERMPRQEARTVTGQVAAMKRREAQQGAYMRARRSFRIWPVRKAADESDEVAVKKFFQKYMAVPVTLLNTINIDTIRKAIEQPARSKIRDEMIVTFAEREERDTIKSYARELAKANGQAGLRLDLPDYLKGHHKILEEHAYAMIELYGKEVKRNIKFDDRADDLMMDIKLPMSNKWHNITMRQAVEARRMKEEKDIQAIKSAGIDRTIDKEKSRALALTASPGAISRTSLTYGPSGVNMTPMGIKKGLSMFSGDTPVVGEDEDEEEDEVSILRGDGASSKS